MRVVVGAATIRDLIADLEATLIRRGRSQDTVDTYRWALKDLAAFAEQAGVSKLADLSEQLLEAWQDSLIAPRPGHPDGLTASSRGVAATAARGLIKLGSRKHLLDRALADVVESVTVPKRLPRPLADPTLAGALLALREPPQRSIAALRNRALFLYLLTTGARVTEILRIRRDDYVRPVVRQKGGSEKKLMPPPSAIAAAEAYLAARTDQLSALFVSHPRGAPSRPLQAGGVRAIWQDMAAELGVQKWTTHQLRHTSATVLSDANVPDLVIAEHLGHHGLATIQNYAQVNDGRRSIVVNIMEALVNGPPEVLSKVVELRPYRKPINKKRRRRR